MAKYVQINSVPNLSTGNVMWRVQAERIAAGDECWAMWGRGREAENDHEFNFGDNLSFYADVALTRLDGKAGFHSRRVTERLLAKLDEIDPDVVHLHNIHGYYVNIEMLFNWLAKHHCHVNWTLHDCWPFTGHCAYFTAVNCDDWKTGCPGDGACCQLDAYPKTILGTSVSWNYQKKQSLFTMIPKDRVTLITPSEWLAGLVKLSVLSKYSVQVRRNEIDCNVFKPTNGSFRQTRGLEGKHIVLGVASVWDDRKGLKDFVRLRDDLGDEFAIVLVGLNQDQIKTMPGGIVALPRTSSAFELADIYSAADIFFNPTKEDNYPTVNLEAEACGTAVVSYDVGGCSETIGLHPSSCVVESYQSALGTILSLLGATKMASEEAVM